MATFFKGMLGKAENEIKTRKDRLAEEEKKAMGGPSTERDKQNVDAANGKIRLTTDDKKYK